jgi:ribose/xylose/arabinose/galactoside ABC-type transport system permease subunit
MAVTSEPVAPRHLPRGAGRAPGRLRSIASERDAMLAGVLGLLVLVLAVRYPQFTGADNLSNILLNVSQVAIVGAGMTMVMITAGIDVSVGSAIAVCAVLVGQFIKAGGSAPLAVLLAVAVGVAIGALNGSLVAFGRVAPIVATFGMLNLLRFVSYELTGGEWVTRMPDTLDWIGTGKVIGVPVAFWIALAVVAVSSVYLARRPTGRHLYALGASEESARLAGVRVRRRLLVVYMVTGALVGVAAVVLVGGAGAIQTNVGVGFELEVIAAVVIGGVSVLGGRGTVLGMLIGALLVGVIRNSLVIANVDALYEGLVLGVLIVAALGIDLIRGHGREDV